MKNAKYIEVLVSPTSWDHSRAFVGDENDVIPCRINDAWNPIIRLEDGKIINWTKGVAADIYMHVLCGHDGRLNAGQYWLLDSDMKHMGKWTGQHIPEYIFRPSDCIDWIEIRVSTDGMIDTWVQPTDLDLEDTWMGESFSPITQPYLATK